MRGSITVRKFFFLICAMLQAAVLSGCGGGPSSSILQPNPPRDGSGSSSSKISHIVLIIQENRTFNDLFATFPGANGTTVGKMRIAGKTHLVNLTRVNLLATKTLDHVYAAFLTAYRDGHMDAFNQIRFMTNGKQEGTQPYQYVDPNQIQPYWTMASQYGLADEMFQTQGSASFVAHQDLIRGGTAIDPSDSLVDEPTGPGPWGCDSKPGTKTSLLTTSLQYLANQGPFPCSNKFPSSSSYETLKDLLEAKSITWKYYTPAPSMVRSGALWNAFLVISSVYNNKSEWNSHISIPETSIFNDINSGTLPAMSWVIPDAQNSDHPAYSSKDTGPSWVASVVNAIGQSAYWNSTAIIIVWDDWGGFYDSVAPPLPRDDQGGPGFRVPMIVVSPYVPTNEISNTVYEFGSVIRFIEDTWSLGRLGTTDGTSTSIVNMFNFNQSPRKFQIIQARYSRAYFLRQRPSGLPVDTE